MGEGIIKNLWPGWMSEAFVLGNEWKGHKSMYEFEGWIGYQRKFECEGREVGWSGQEICL